MSTIQVKPHPDLDPAAWPLLIHPASGGLLDAAKNVPDDGRPWLNDGFTARMLTDGAILRADDAVFAQPDAKPDPAPAPAAIDAPKPILPASASAKPNASAPAAN